MSKTIGHQFSKILLCGISACGDVYIHAIKYTEIPEVNLFAFAFRLFHEDFSPLNRAPSSGEKSS